MKTPVHHCLTGRPESIVDREEASWLLPFLLAVTCFLPSLGHGFLPVDDPVYVTANPMVAEGLTPKTLWWALTTLDGGFYHPLVWLSLLTVSEFFGQSAWAYHGLNVLLHGLAAGLFGLFLRRVSCKTLLAALLAALWAVHPLRVESVAWVAELKDCLAAVFWMLTLVVYDRHARNPDGSRYLASLGCFGLGLLAKPMLVSLPFVLLLLDIWPYERLTRERWLKQGTLLVLEKLPFFALAAGASVLALRAEAAVGALDTARPLAERALTALSAYGDYIRATFWPADLSLFHPYAPPGDGVSLGVGLLLVGSLAALAAAFYRRRYRGVLVGWLWFVGALVPVSGIVQVGAFSHADRFTYLPQAGLALALVALLPPLRRREGVPVRLPLLLILLALLVGGIVRTQDYLADWREPERLFTSMLRRDPANELALNNMGNLLARRGACDRAVGYYERVLAVNPEHHLALRNLAGCRASLGDGGGAVAAYERYLTFVPTDAEARRNLLLLRSL